MGFLRKPNARRLRRVRPPPWEASHTTGCRVFPPAWNGGIGAFSPPTSDRRCDAAGSDRMQKAAARESFARKTRRAKEKPPASAGPRLGASSGRSAVMRAAEKNRPLDVRAQAARARGGTVPTRRLCRNVDIVALLIGICRQWFDTWRSSVSTAARPVSAPWTRNSVHKASRWTRVQRHATTTTKSVIANANAWRVW